MNGFDWDSAAASPKDEEIDNAAIGGKLNSLVYPRGKALAHTAGPMLLQYACDGCPVDVGRIWTKD